MLEKIKESNLSEVSKRHYESKVKRLEKITGHDIKWVIENCEETLDFLEEQGIKEPQSIRTYINTVLALYKYNPELKDKNKIEYEKWVAQFKRYDKVTEMKYMTSQASPKQVESHVPWRDIIAKRDSLDKTSIEYFILSLYTMIEPARADYNYVRIYTNREPRAEEREEIPNYLLIRNGTMILVLNEYKSATKRVSKYENELPKDLQKVIKTSLKLNPRKFLVVSPRNNKPYMNVHSYTVYIDRLLKKIFKKEGFSINTLRHSHIMSLDWNNMTPLEEVEKANKMMHTISTMKKYKLRIPQKEEEDKGKRKICKVQCKMV